MTTIPPFYCAEQCQAPDEFFSGGPWVYHPRNRILLLKSNDKSFIEWQTWDGLFAKANESSAFKLEGKTIFEVKIYFQIIKLHFFHICYISKF